MAEHERPDTPRGRLASEPHDCKQRAEDPQLATTERLVWAVLAVAGELRIIRKQMRRG